MQAEVDVEEMRNYVAALVLRTLLEFPIVIAAAIFIVISPLSRSFMTVYQEGLICQKAMGTHRSMIYALKTCAYLRVSVCVCMPSHRALLNVIVDVN